MPTVADRVAQTVAARRLETRVDEIFHPDVNLWADTGHGGRSRGGGLRPSRFTMTKGGYVVTLKEGKVSQSYGEHYPEWRKAAKTSALARTSRRV